MAKRTPTYSSLQDWMERNGKNGDDLYRLVQEGTTVDMTRQHLSKVLSGSRRCSLRIGLALAYVTGVPVQNIVRWPRVAKPATSRSDAETMPIAG
jgi:hypothetical protein